MEKVPGVLFYEISIYSGLEYIPVMELFSTRIKNKLHGNKSGFQYLLRKYYDVSDLLDFTESKNVLKDEQITLIGVRGGTNQLFIYNTRLRN